MKPSFFIERPIFAAVLSLLILFLGVLGFYFLPIDQYPAVSPPMVKISASYPGANAMTVAQALATPLEQELNGTPGMLYMESSSSNTGGLTINVTFDVGVDPNLAAVEVQNRVKLAENRLPAEVLQNGISVDKLSASQLMTIGLTSSDPKYDEIYLSNFATINVLDPLRRIPGVGRISNVGSRYYGMRIWVMPDRLASYGLTVKDLQDAIRDQNRESAAGELGLQPAENVEVSMPISAPGRLSSPGEFEEIVVRANPDGSIVRLRDIARVSLESSTYSQESGLNGKNAAVLAIYLLPGANAMEVAKQIRKTLADLQGQFPEGIDYLVPFDTTEYIDASIQEVYKTLAEALLLVIVVVYLSLQNWRATLVPVIAVPISLIGTFGVMLALGFSLNMLTLLGLILAIGIVVDDAIVVVENVERIMTEEKLSAREATHKAMKELTGAIVATSLVLAAVFVPVSFLGGITGVLYRQFSVTIAVSVLISTFVALTLSPAMCALLLRPHTGKKARIFQLIDQWLDVGNRYTLGFVSKLLAFPRRVWTAFALVCVGILVLGKLVPTSFIPEEDQGYFKIELELPEGATLERTREVMDRAVAYLNKHPMVEYVQHVGGASSRVGSSQSRADLTVILKPWEVRKEAGVDLQQVMDDVRAELSKYPEAISHLSKPAAIPGLGGAGGFEMQLQAKSGATWEQLVAANDTLLHYAAQSPALKGVTSALQPEIPQLYFDVDRDRVKLLGVPMAEVFSTMKAYLGSVYVNDFNMFNRIYRVYIQADAPYRTSASNLGLFSVRAGNGSMVPLTALGNTQYTTGAGNVKRFNMFNTAVVRGGPAPGYSSGEAMEALEEIGREHLPENIGIGWSGLSYQERKAEGQLPGVMALVLLFVFLFLAAQYESWLVPVAVLLTLPLPILGAFAGVWVLGLQNDIYFQIGLVMLVGLAAKNAILIVEFAKVLVDDGMDPAQAALQAAGQRFRPIVMTSLAFVLGMLPLVLAEGPGAASRHSIGTGVFFGMLIAITVGMVFTPFLFVSVYSFREKLSAWKSSKFSRSHE